MQNNPDKCENCEKLKNFIAKQLLISESAFDLALDVYEFIKNCECEENEDGEYRDSSK